MFLKEICKFPATAGCHKDLTHPAIASAQGHHDGEVIAALIVINDFVSGSLAVPVGATIIAHLSTFQDSKRRLD